MLWFLPIMNSVSSRSGFARVSSSSEVKAFTLVELMIVVAVIALLAVIAVPAYAKVRTSSQSARFIADLRTARGAYIQYCMEHGNYPPDATPGIVPAGMSEYLGRFDWTGPTAIGGQWDWDYRQFGCVAGVSVYQPTADIEQLKQIDKAIDDGDLSTGTFQARTAGYIYVIE